MDKKTNTLYALLLDGREHAALYTLLYQHSTDDELLRGIRDKLTVIIAEIECLPQ